MRKVLVFIALIFILAFKHPFYLGVTDLKYNSLEKKLEGSVKLFTNDFEATLKKLQGKNIDLINTKNKDETALILFNYLKNHFTLKINGKKYNYKLIGFEPEGDAIWMYLEFEKSQLPKKIEIENSLLYNIKEQTNIVHIEINNLKKSQKLNNPDKNLIYEF